MNELIPITTNEKQEPCVSARALHEYLEVGTRYSIWIDRMLEYGFSENEDYQAIDQKRTTAQGNETTYTDHVLKLDMAKELCMIQRSDKGKQARQYFLQVERDFNSPEKVMARALKLADIELAANRATIRQLETKNEEMKPLAAFAESVQASDDCILIRDLAKNLTQDGIPTGERKLYRWMRENGYLISANSSDRNKPTQRAMNMGLFRVLERTHQSPDGTTMITRTTKVTGKGQAYFLLGRQGSYYRQSICYGVQNN